MGLEAIVARAKRGIREDLTLYVVTVASLTVAFVALGTALLGVTNLSAIRAHWGQSHRLTVYLREEAPPDDVHQLSAVLEGLPSVERMEHLTPALARERFLEDSSIDTDLAELPPDVFPASLEVRFRAQASEARMQQVAERVRKFSAVDEVETYQGWFARLASLIDAGETIASMLSLMVLICVVSVVGNTIRLAVANRREEIEVLKMCGATDGFVRGPLVVEGALQGALAAGASLVLLSAGFGLLQGELDALLVPLSGLRTSFLPLWMIASLLIGGTLAGAVGSAVSVRRYLTV